MTNQVFSTCSLVQNYIINKQHLDCCINKKKKENNFDKFTYKKIQQSVSVTCCDGMVAKLSSKTRVIVH